MMPSDRLRWGILSTARINRSLIPPLRQSPRNELMAVASRSEERAREYALAWDIPRAYGSYGKLLLDPEIDAVYISLPNSLHADWAIESVQAGKHVLCEKPLALSVAEVDSIEEEAERAGRIVTEAFMYRHHPQTSRVIELIAEGAIGELQLIRGGFSFPLDQPGDVRLDPDLGGGSVWDIGCYPISYARTLVGTEPLEVFGWGVRGMSGVDELFAGQLRFPGEIYAQFDSSFRTHIRMEVTVIGSTGSLIIPNPFKPGLEEVLYLDRGGDVETIRMPAQELYLGEVEDLADAALLGRPPLISLKDSRSNVATIHALLRSAEIGEPVLIS